MPDFDGTWVGTANHEEVFADMQGMGMNLVETSVSGLGKVDPGLNNNNNGGPEFGMT